MTTHFKYFMVVLVVILGLHATNMTRFMSKVDSRLAKMNSTIASLEGRISIHEGKAVLTIGRTCMLNEKAFETEELTIKLARACYQQYHNSQE